MNIAFHCDEKSNFKEHGQFVRAFAYTDYSIEPHNHDFYEMNLVLGGNGIHQIEASRFSVTRGDVFVIPPMAVHAYYNTEHLEVYHILLKKDFIRSNRTEAATVPGFLQLMEIEPFLRQSCSEALFLHLNSAQLMEVQRDIKMIEDRGAFDQACFSALRHHVTWKLLYYLSYLLHEQIVHEKKPETAKYRWQVLDTLEHIHHHYAEKITVTDLAERVYLSRSTFLRNFQAVCGCTPIQYLNQYRIKIAAELLESSSLSKTEIAHSCGFFDLSHMERMVKKANGFGIAFIQ